MPRRRLARRPAPVVALAASLALIVAAIAAWSPWSERGPSARWVAEAVASHRAWLDGGSSMETGERIRVALAAQGAAGIPDLTEARLSLVHLSIADRDGRARGLLAGYQGIHGCRVGLWIGEPTAALGAEPVAVESDGVAGYAWREGATGYALLARGMDPDRLRLLARAVFRITNDGHRIDERIRTALRQTTVTGVPCAA